MKNDTKQFRFLEASWVLLSSTFICLMILNAFIVFKVQHFIQLPKNGYIGILVVSFIVFMPILISRLVSFSKTTVTLNKKEIKVKRTSPIGFPIKPDFQLPYSQIHSFVFQKDQNWYWLKIKDLNGKVYRIWKFGWFKNTEYKNFRERFTNEINWFNQESSESENIAFSKRLIKAADNIYQGKSGIILLIISALFIIAIPVILIVIDVQNMRSLGPGLIGLSGAIFTFFKVIHERKKKNTVANTI